MQRRPSHNPPGSAALLQSVFLPIQQTVLGVHDRAREAFHDLSHERGAAVLLSMVPLVVNEFLQKVQRDTFCFALHGRIMQALQRR